MKHTNFDNEIDGRYHNEDEGIVGLYIGILVVGISLLLILLDHTGLVDKFIGV